MSIYTYNGGTVIAMAGDECVCIASDLRLGEQMNLVATDMKKVGEAWLCWANRLSFKMYKLSDRVYIGMAGFQSDAQTVLEKLRFQVGLYELRENRKMSPKVAATMASNLLYKHRFGGYIVGPVVAGLDPVTNKSFVSASDGIGCVTNPKDFVATGCGAEYALNLCEGLLPHGLLSYSII